MISQYRILIDDTELPPSISGNLISLTVDQQLGLPAFFVLELDRSAGAFEETEIFHLGARVIIELGGEPPLLPVMMGEITGFELDYEADSALRLRILGHDLLHRLARGRKIRTFAETSDGEIVEALAEEHELVAEVDPTELVLDVVQQHDESDLDFLLRRAARIGYEVSVRERILRFRRPRFEEPAVMTLSKRGSLLAFRPRLSSMTQVGEVSVRGWSPLTAEPLVGVATAGMEGRHMGGVLGGPEASVAAFGETAAPVVGEPVWNEEEAEFMARGQLSARALAYVRATGSALGDARLEVGSVVAVEELGERFSGDYYLVAARHRLTPAEGYRTDFRARRNAA